MRSMGRIGLSIPTLLSVSTIVACGDDENGDEQADTTPADDDGSTGVESSGTDESASSPTSVEESSGPTSAESSGSAETTAADESTTADSTGVDDGSSSDTGELPDCMAIASEDECGTEAACIWHPDYGPACVVNCELIQDEATCEPLDECLWYKGMCEFEFLK